ncbi:MAG: TlpA disulfide reductase family protein [Dehalococcoidia bacterium]
MEPVTGSTLPTSNSLVRLIFRYFPIVLASAGIVLLIACGGSGQTARDFEVVQFDGATFRLSEETAGHAVVLNFWYPSCPPCREEMPAFEAAWQELKDGPVRFLGLYVPQGFDTEEEARDFVDELGLTFSFATDRLARIAQAYELEYFPKTYFIDMDGKVVATHISVLEPEEIIRQVRALTAS